ncbi:ATP-dependent nuclease [Pseudalkalibacillus hwajinpoensis]|uniref:ATP-dependent nuclease n=1 Tax=Guptibacillus hwajinpoensis TaxID=208199 RepID=UPI001CD691FB|nr:AAA family ATPase [Pseudalkalibacillus hwajinpoensis]MCA0992970.1 AAA family ATPase [Pseudalkalibacillus hwajinpoensis]
MQIKTVRIERFKSIKDITFDASELTAIVGKNNYGKTAIYEAIQMFFNCSKVNTKDIHMNRSNQLPIITIEFKDVTIENLHTLLKSKNESDTDTWVSENNFNGYLTITATFNTNSHSISYNLVSTGKEKINNKDLKICLPEIKYISSIRQPEDTTFNNKTSNIQQLMDLLTSEDEEEEISFDKNTHSISSIKKSLKQHEERKVKQISQDITGRFQNILGHDSLSIDINVESTDIVYKHKTKIIDHDIQSHSGDYSANGGFDILSSGTGMQSVMILTILEAYVEHNVEKDFILIIEEPEVYLHPSLQRKMIKALKKVSESNQVLISSHSPLVVSQLSPSQLISIRKNNGITSIIDYEPEDLINELGIKPDDVFQYTNVLFVEGSDDKELIQALVTKYVDNNLVDEHVADQLKILDVDGIKTMSFYANARIMNTINSSFHKNYNFWILTDSDGDTPDEVKSEIEKDLKGDSRKIYDQSKLFTLNHYALESYFINDKILPFIANVTASDAERISKRYFDIYREKREMKNQSLLKKVDFQNKFKPKNFFDTKKDVFYEMTWQLDITEIEIIKNIQQGWSKRSIKEIIESIDIETLMDTDMKEITNALTDIFNTIKKKQS